MTLDELIAQGAPALNMSWADLAGRANQLDGSDRDISQFNLQGMNSPISIQRGAGGQDYTFSTPVNGNVRDGSWVYERGADGKPQGQYAKYNSDIWDSVVMALAGGFLGGAAGGAFGGTPAAGTSTGTGFGYGTSGASSGTGATAGASDAGGGMLLDTAGMPATGPGGVGSASSVVGAGGGGATYGGTAAATAGGSTLSNLGGKALDAATSKAGMALIGGAASAMSGGAKKDGEQTVTTRQEIDPRMAAILYGDKGNNGFLSQLMQQANTPQMAGANGFGNLMDDYLGDWGANNFMSSQHAAQKLQGSNIAAPTMQAAQVNAPSQNNLNLQPAFQDMIYGQPGNNPYLTGAIQKGINQSTNAFQDMQTDMTKNLTQNVLPGIRSGARVSGSYGGDREGIATGSAIGQFGTDMTRAAQRFGQGNTDAAVAAQAGQYDADRNRQLAAMQGLSGQQYGTAQMNAQLQQQANQANLQSSLNTNQLNSSNQQAGIGLSSGLLDQAYGYGTNQDSYGLNKTGQVAGLLSPFTGLGGSQTQSQPLYKNNTNNILGGITAGLGIWNAFNG